jgi:diacylglycerol O-acyltransferase
MKLRTSYASGDAQARGGPPSTAAIHTGATDRPLRRLTAVDLINLAVETPSSPARVGALAIFDGKALIDHSGRLRLAEIQEAIGERLDGVPRLRQVIHRPGILAGRPIWTDDRSFRVDRHVRQITLNPGDELTDLALRLVNAPLDRAQPLWRMWFVTGLPDGRVALVFGMHHVVADGTTAIRLVSSLMDPPPRRPTRRWVAQPPPRWGHLVRDNLRALRPYVRLPQLGQWRRMVAMRHAPRTSLNYPSVPIDVWQRSRWTSPPPRRWRTRRGERSTTWS